MSRRAHYGGDSQPAFSWRIRAIGDARGRFIAECKSRPAIYAFGDTEQIAMRRATEAMDLALRRGDFDHMGNPAPPATPATVAPEAAPATVEVV